MRKPNPRLISMSPISMYMDGELVGILKPTHMKITDGDGEKEYHITWPEEKQEEHHESKAHPDQR